MVELVKRTVRPARPDMTPLLDVVFILLIFFVVSAVFTAKGMDVDLPPAETSRPVTGQSLEITLAADGTLTCNDEHITLHDLGFILRDAMQAPPSQRPAQVLFKASPQANVGAFIATMDVARGCGVDNMVIATGSAKDAAS